MRRVNNTIYIKNKKLGERGTHTSRRQNVRNKKQRLYETIKNMVLSEPIPPSGLRPRFSAEEIALTLGGIKKHYVVQVFDILVREGILTKDINQPPHDCKRSTSPFDCGNDNSWVSKMWVRRV